MARTRCRFFLLGEAIDLARQGQVETLTAISEKVGEAVKPPENFKDDVAHPVEDEPPIRPVKPPLFDK